MKPRKHRVSDESGSGTNERTAGPSFKEMDRIVKRHMAAAFATGLVPIPLLDMAAMTGVVCRREVIGRVPIASVLVKDNPLYPGFR